MMRTIFKTTAVFILTILAVHHSYSQDLPRRVYLGIRMENLTDDAKGIMELDTKAGILVTEALPNSTAEKAGFKKGDVLVSLNNEEVFSTQDVLSVLAALSPGSSFSYDFVRNKKHVKGKSVLQSFPEEKYADLDVVYTSSKSDIGLQRIILTKPKAGKKFPVLAFIGGVGCYSLDNTLDTNRSESRLLNFLSRAGFLCARLEKPGMGDNAKYCKSCQEVGFMEEANGYINAIETLKHREDVDSNAVYIIGHSMGGVFAPIIAQKTHLRGIISYGTIGSSFIEYLAKTRRTIGEAYNMNPVETDNLVKEFCECAGYYFVEKMTTQQAAEKKAACKDYVSIFDLRSRTYNDELYALNIPELWSSFTGKALFLWGGSDYISSKEDHLILNDAVNFYHKGNSTFQVIKNTDHGMGMAASFQESQKNPNGTYNAEVGITMLQWLKEVN